MCYDAEAQLRSQLKRAERLGQSPEDIAYIKELLKIYDSYYHVSGYSHPELMVYTSDDPFRPIPMKWGLIPHWTKSLKDGLKFWNNTLNCRSETMFEKASFRSSAYKQRCLISVDGFYEHHHSNGKTYPFHIGMANKQPFYLGGLWSEWLDKETGELIKTFTIITTKGNALMQKIHNNPKLQEARMPLILAEEVADKWLDSNLSKAEVQALMLPFDTGQMHAYTVGKLRGKNYIGNIEAVKEEVVYGEVQII